MKRIKKTDDLRERIILWLACQPADKEYCWSDHFGCACAQFCTAMGYRYASMEWAKVFAKYDSIAYEQPWTFGDLLQRVRQTVLS
jgi:hypothetical protein